MKTIFLYIIIFLFLCSFMQQKKTGEASTIRVRLHFKPVCEQEILEPGKTYHNAWGEAYSVDRFRFYISHISLLDTSVTNTYRTSSGDCYLVDIADSASLAITVPVMVHAYNKLEFLLGVDSTVNTGGAQSGALDPLKGMFWTWNSGYVTAKLEGISPLSNQPGHIFTYHIGGYRDPYNTARKISLSFPASVTVKDGGNYDFYITANTNAWFSGNHEIRISQTPGCMTPGMLANAIADNYANMFSLEQSPKTNP